MTSLWSSKFKEKLVAAAVTFTYNDNTTMETFGILIDTIVTNTKMLNLLNSLLPEGSSGTGTGWRWALQQLEDEVGVCGVTLKECKTNDVNSTNKEILLNRSFTTIIHDQLALLDTGAEINVIEVNTLAKITSFTRQIDIKQDAVVVDHRRVKMDEIVFVLVFLCYSYAMWKVMLFKILFSRDDGTVDFYILHTVYS